MRSILNRHVNLSTEEEYFEKEELLREKLNVPPHWIHHAKVNRKMSLVMRKPTFWFPTWSDTNQAVQLQMMARRLKFQI